MHAPPLRPRGIGEILDTGVQLYRARFIPVVTATAVLVLPLFVFLAVAPLDLFRYVDVVANLFFLAASAATVTIVSGAYQGQETSAGKALRHVGRRFLSIWGAAVLQAVAVGVGLLLLVIPGIILYIMSFAMQQAVVIEGVPASSAFERSSDLASGNFKRVLFTSVLVLILTYMVMYGVGLAVGTVAPGVRMTSLLIYVALVMLNPLAAVVSTVLYYDLRIRKEAYDVAVLADGLTTTKAAPAV